MATFSNNTGVKITGKGLAGLQADLELLSRLEILVGVPDDHADRTEDDGIAAPKEINNAALAYIHDNGAPEVNIPARPFMEPGIKAAEGRIEEKLSQTMRAVLRGGGVDKIQQGFTQVGLIAQLSIQNTINEGIPPPLSEMTLRNRMRKGRRDGAGARKGAARELDRRWDGQLPSTEFAKPLVDTGQLLKAITYVIRDKKMRGG